MEVLKLLKALAGAVVDHPCLALEVVEGVLPYLASGVLEDRWRRATEEAVVGHLLMAVEVLGERLAEGVAEDCCCGLGEVAGYMTTRALGSSVAEPEDQRLYSAEEAVQDLEMEVQVVLRIFCLL